MEIEKWKAVEAKERMSEGGKGGVQGVENLPHLPGPKASDEAGAMLGTVRENLPQRSRFLEHGYKACRWALTKPVVELTGKSSGGNFGIAGIMDVAGLQESSGTKR